MNGGKRGETRSSALWGTGNRGGESRSSALWGKGGRGAITALVAMLAISVPLASSAVQLKHAKRSGHATLKKTWISPGLLKGAKRHPNQYVRVIIQSTNGQLSPALSAFTHVNQFADDDRGGLDRRLTLINGVSATVRASALPRLMRMSNLTVTPDVPVKLSDYNSAQLWPYESGASQTWSGLNSISSWNTPTIAIVDSGIQAGRADFGYGNRVKANVNFTTLPNNSNGDGRGHGTFVAGIAAGSADGYTGTTPQANLVSLDVMDDSGVARTSDVIAAAQWIVANKSRYNIRVANFSLHSSLKTNFFRDPLDRAVEKLWFSGV
ncbi:MAG: S8 family serine peptidase, partial [Gaiellaceae bacterium]